MKRNPYDFTRPVREKRFFAGRENELKEIRYYLEQAIGDDPKYYSMALIGKRASGKTSLLNMISFMANEMKLLPVKINLNNELVAHDVLFFKELLDGVMTEGAKHGMYGGLGKKTYKRFRKMIDMLDLKVEVPFLFGTAYVGKERGAVVGMPQHVLVHDFEELIEEAKKSGIKGIVLLFDECDLLSTNETLLQKVRNIFQDVDGYVIVLAGTKAMFPKVSDVFSPLPRFFKRINVKSYDEVEETRDCILKPLQDEEKKLVDFGSAYEIHGLTGGFPYEINLIAHYMYRRYASGENDRITLTVDVLDAVMDELERLREGGHHEVASKIRECSKTDLYVLTAIIELGRSNEEVLEYYTMFVNLDNIDDAKKEQKRCQDSILRLLETAILTKLDSDELVFAGDDFDFLYAKYYVISKDIRVFPNEGVESVSPRNWLLAMGSRLLPVFSKHVGDLTYLVTIGGCTIDNTDEIRNMSWNLFFASGISRDDVNEILESISPATVEGERVSLKVEKEMKHEATFIAEIDHLGWYLEMEFSTQNGSLYDSVIAGNEEISPKLKRIGITTKVIKSKPK